MNNNPFTYNLTTPTWMPLASFECLALSQVPIYHNHETVCSLMEGAIVGTVDQSEAEANEELLCEHVCLENEARVQAAKLALKHVVDWGEAQETDAVLAACRKWLKACKDTPSQKRDTLLKKYLGSQVDTGGACSLPQMQQHGSE